LPPRGSRSGGVLPSVSGHVPTRRPYFEDPFMTDLHRAGFRAPRFGHIPSVHAGDRYHTGMAGFAVIRSDRRRTLERRTVRFGAGRPLEDDVAARQPTDVEPPIRWSGHAKAKIVIIRVRATDQHLPSVRQSVRDDTAVVGGG